MIKKALFADLSPRRRRLRKKIGQSHEQLYRIAFAWCHDHHMAEDLVQAASEKALKNMHRLKQDGALSVWLYRIMNHCWLDNCRQRKDFVVYDVNTPSQEAGPESCQIELETANRVRRAVASLEPGFRQVITLVDLQGCSYIDTARILDIPVGTVMSRVSRSRNRLRESLDELVTRERPASVGKIRRIK